MLDLTRPDDNDLDPIDHDALRRCMALACADDPQRRNQLLSIAFHQSWLEAAQLAAAVCQCQTMGLRPWESPPCALVAGDDTQPEAEKWARRLLCAQLSIYEPNPPEALARAAKARKPK